MVQQVVYRSDVIYVMHVVQPRDVFHGSLGGWEKIRRKGSGGDGREREVVHSPSLTSDPHPIPVPFPKVWLSQSLNGLERS